MKTITDGFYARPVLQVAHDLIGCVVEHGDTAGVIVETEAYHESEPACHAFIGVTPRTRTLFGPPGRAYLYRSYGIHVLLNAVCEPEGVGAAVLIRALEPTAGCAVMRRRRWPERTALDRGERELCSGPGKLTEALGVSLEQNGSDLSSSVLRITAATQPLTFEIATGPRIGITKAMELPWRFCMSGNSNVSRPRL